VVYACKAYINKALARIFMEEGLGLDVVSGGELAVARSVEFPMERVYFHGNNKSGEELLIALSWGIGCVVVDNFQELTTLQELAAKAGKRQPILVRVSPDVDPHTHAYISTGVLDSKFGFPIKTGDAEKAIVQALKSPNLELVGLHFHLGSSIFETEPYAIAMKVVLEFAAPLKKAGFRLSELNSGGGFAIAYTRDQNPPTVQEYAHVIVGSMVENCHRLGLDPPRLVLEPGRAIVGPACVAIYQVGVIKDIPGVRKYVAVDGGMGDNIRPALYGAVYEAFLANRMKDEAVEKVTVAGKYCESGDILVKDVTLPKVRHNDLVALPASGAYCPPMSSNYNLFSRPAVVMVKDEKARLIRRRETIEDMTCCDLD
jgi:diaminopimelate decarboxylase